MSKVTLSTLSSLTNQESAITLINENFAALAEAIDLTVFRNGASPNTLSANLDLNGFKIINSGAAVDETDLIRLADVPEGVRGPQGDPGVDGGPLSNGDYGDIVVSNGGLTFTIDSGVITTAARTVLDDTTIGAMRTTLGLGGAATKDVGTSSTQVAAGNDSRFAQWTSTTFSSSTNFDNTYNYWLHNSASAHALTINPQATTAIDSMKPITVYNPPSNGAITITRGSGVGLYINGGTTSANATMAAGAIGTLHRYSGDNWVLVGPGIS